MDCSKVLDRVYEDEKMPLFMRIRIGLHLIACDACARKVERYGECREILLGGFMPSAPGLEGKVMAMIEAEESDASQAAESEVAGGFSTKGWVIVGLAMLVSLATAFFITGKTYIIPIGITVGIVLTIYSLLFIGSHLKELSERFGLFKEKET